VEFREFISTNLEGKLSELILNWENDKTIHIKNQIEIETNENQLRLEDYNFKRDFLYSMLSGASDFVYSQTDILLNSIKLPIEFSIDYHYSPQSKSFYVDLDLPEIEHIPQQKAAILASGKLSVKAKTKLEIKEQYAKCTTGLAFFFAGLLFNISTAIMTVIISGYTQRSSKKSSDIADDYIYSIEFDRTTFSELELPIINPVQLVKRFKSIIDISGTFEMKSINPFDNSEIQAN
jgi:hypothetical protein